MTNDFEKVLQGIKTKLAVLQADSLSQKAINYGSQFTMERGTEKCVLSVYSGKKGIKYVWGGKENTLRKEAQKLLEEQTERDYCLLRQQPGFDGIWVGSDESGKGDFFGPLVVAAVLVDLKVGEQLVSVGVKDCKELTDKKISELVPAIKELAIASVVLPMKPSGYNMRYEQLRLENCNLNTLLSKGHVAALSQCISQVSQCRFALVDRFAVHNIIEADLLQSYPYLTVVQRPRAEEDIAVAAASVLARARFIEIMDELSAIAGCDLPKGGGSAATECAQRIAAAKGKDFLTKLVKKHFVNYQRI